MHPHLAASSAVLNRWLRNKAAQQDESWTGLASIAFAYEILVGSGFSAPPMTFEVNGKQYIVIASGLGAGAKVKLDNTPKLRDQRNVTVLYVFAV